MVNDRHQNYYATGLVSSLSYERKAKLSAQGQGESILKILLLESQILFIPNARHSFFVVHVQEF